MMRTRALEPNPPLFWSSILAAATFVVLIVYPQLRAWTLPTGTAVAQEQDVKPLAPPSYASLLADAQARLGALPTGVKRRQDIADQLKAEATKAGLASSQDLERTAELQAREMTELRFRSNVDQNGMDTADRLAMLDRVGLYSLADESFSEASASDPRQRAEQKIAAGLDAPGTARIASGAYNHFGIGCVEADGRILCVRTVARLAGRLSRPLPVTMSRGSTLAIQPLLEPGATAQQLVLRDTVGTNKIPNSTLFSDQVRLPSDYVGLLRLRIVTQQGTEKSELKGPTVDVR